MRDLTAMATHDLRTPVNAIHLTGKLMKETKMTPEQAELVADQQVATRMMVQIIDNVLTHEHIASGRLDKIQPTIKHVDVVELVDRVVQVRGCGLDRVLSEGFD